MKARLTYEIKLLLDKVNCFFGNHDVHASWTKHSGGAWEYEERCRQPGCEYCKIEGKAPSDPAKWEDVIERFENTKKDFDSLI